VLGFDTPMSMDHDWGPSVHLLLRDEDAALAPVIHERLRHTLPHEFAGYPVGTAIAPDGVRWMQASAEGPVEHRVYAETLRHFTNWHLGHPYDQPFDAADWLVTPSQALRELTAGAVHWDGVGALTALRERLRWYPHDLWLYLLAAGWTRIGQEEHLMGRAGYVGDELGSSLIGSRLVRDVMSLCFLMEQQYAPYPKWFGTAWKGLRCAAALEQVLRRAQLAATWQEREAALSEAYAYLAEMHNALTVTPPLPTSVGSFHGRPFKVIDGGTFANALVAEIDDPVVKRIAGRRLIGNIDQWSDSTDMRGDTHWRRTARGFYEA
jgi:hypothetical protein